MTVEQGPLYHVDPPLIDRFGRQRQYDERNEAHRMRRQLETAARELARKRHYQRPYKEYNQRGGTCVGHTGRWVLDCGPFMLDTGRWYQFTPIGPNPYMIYREACKHDIWTQNDTGDINFGTSILGMAKAMQKVLTVVLPKQTTPTPLIGEYTWTNDAGVVVDFLRAGLGTIAIGVDWTDGMMDTDNEGFIHPTGVIRGGHAVCLDGVDIGKVGEDMDPDIYGTTSWGRWGFRGNSIKSTSGAWGRFKIKASALHPLLSRERWGEAMTSVEAGRHQKSMTDEDEYRQQYQG